MSKTVLREGFVLRDFEPRDAAAVAAMFNRFEQEHETPDSLLQRFYRYPKHMPASRLVLQAEGQVVAYGNAVHAQTDRHIFLIRVEVANEFQGRGLGKEMLAICEAIAQDGGAEWFMSKVRADLVRERAFLEAAGYVQEQHLYGVELELDKWELRVPPRVEGIEITSWEELGDTPQNRQMLFNLYTDTDSDTPGCELWGLAGFEDWQAGTFGARWFRPDGCFVAIGSAGDWVGVSLVGPTDAENFTTDFTGIKRKQRGRGIAKALKVVGANWAKLQGGAVLHTYNDDRNGAMRAINGQLGFRSKTGWRMMKKEPCQDAS